MKKTLFTALAMLGTVGAAMAADPAPTIAILTDKITELTGTVVNCNGAPFTSGPSLPWINNQELGTSGISITYNGSQNGKMWTNNYSTTAAAWTNTAALDEMTKNLGTSVTAAGLIAAGFVAPGPGGSSSNSMSFTFGTASGYTSGSKIVMYLALSQGAESAGKNLTAVSVASGLTDSSVTYALAGGDGFGSSLTGMGTGVLAIARIEGVLAEGTDTVGLNFTTGGVRNGLGVLAIAPVPAPTPDPSPVVPEPATATLSLLALAGLAARRRRKH